MCVLAPPKQTPAANLTPLTQRGIGYRGCLKPEPTIGTEQIPASRPQPERGDQLQGNIHSLRANGIGLVVGLAGFVWGARGITRRLTRQLHIVIC